MEEKLSIALGVLIGGIALVLGFIFDFFWWALYFVGGLFILGIYWLTTGRHKR